MNIVITGIIIFVITFLLLSWFARQKTRKIAQGARSLIIILSLFIKFLVFYIPKLKLLYLIVFYFCAIRAGTDVPIYLI